MKKTIAMMLGCVGCFAAAPSFAADAIVKNIAELVIYHPQESTDIADAALPISFNGKVICSLPNESFFTLQAKPGINHVAVATSDMAVDTKAKNHYYIRITGKAAAIHAEAETASSPFILESVSEELAKSELSELHSFSCAGK